MICKQSSSAKLKVRDDSAARIQVPFQPQWIQAESVCRARGLKNRENRDDIDGIFKPPA
jgi:hypothetical protein